MKRFFRHFAFAAFGVSILCLALGIAMLIWTATAMKWISYGFGAVMILSGILQIASYLTGERVGLLRKLLLISGIIAAVAGVIGGGGLGDIAIRYGYYRYDTGVMLVTLVFIVAIVQLLQGMGNLAARKIDHRK